MGSRRSFLAACGAFFASFATVIAGSLFWKDKQDPKISLPNHKLADKYRTELEKLNRDVLQAAKDMDVEILPESANTTGWEEIVSFPQCKLNEVNGDPLGKHFEKITNDMISNLQAASPKQICPIKVLSADDHTMLRVGIIIYFPIST